MNASEMKRLTKMKTENEGSKKRGGGRKGGTYWEMGVEGGRRDG